jgi:hypothetical protein
MEHVEEVQELETAAPSTPVCAGCTAPLAMPAPRTPLCPDCRDQFIRFPIPFWIRVFGGGVLLVVLFCLYRLPENLKTGIHFKRGKAAAESHNYVSAQKEFELAVGREPGFLEAQCRLLLAAYHNDDYTTVYGVSNTLQGKSIEDNELLNEMTGVVTTMNRYFPTDSFRVFTERWALPEDSIPVNAYTQYMAQNPDDDYATLRLGSILLDKEAYGTVDSLMDGLLQKHPGFHPALTMKVSAKRNRLQFDSAHYFADQLLAENHENVYALSAKARTLLKEKKDREALALAKRGYALNEREGHTIATLALAYHFNNDAKSRDALLKKAESDTAAAEYITMAKDIISGKESFRD